MKISKNLFVRFKKVYNINNKLHNIDMKMRNLSSGDKEKEELYKEESVLCEKRKHLQELIDKDFQEVLKMFDENLDVVFDIEDIAFMLEAKQSSIGKIVMEKNEYLIIDFIKQQLDEKLTVVSTDIYSNKEDNFYGYVCYSDNYFDEMIKKSQVITKKSSGLYDKF